MIMATTNTNKAAANMNNKIKIHCPNCGGTGYLPRCAHIADGVCFWCRGTGKLTVDAETTDATEQAAIRAAEWTRLQAESTYILEDDFLDNWYSDDLCKIAEACEKRRAQVKNPHYDPMDIYLIHRATGERVTRGQEAAARKETA